MRCALLDPLSRPRLDLPRAVAALARQPVRWILAGSHVLAAHGARLEPRDLDVVPALDRPNLEAVAALLDVLDAVPAHDPEWPQCPSLEWHGTWVPRPANVENLDYLFVTAVGMLDIVPRLCGTFEELRPRAQTADVRGYEVLVAHPSTVLARIDGRRRKDQARRREIAAVRARLDAGRLREPDLSTLTGHGARD